MVSRYGGPQIQAMLPGAVPSLLQPSLELDMNIYSARQQFPQDPSMLTTCPELMPTIPIFPSSDDGQPPTAPLLEAGCSIVLVEEKYPLALELALLSLDELAKMCHLTKPLWVRSDDKFGVPREALNFEEHARLFPCHYSKLCPDEFGINEASRDSAVIIMNSVTLVSAFLDAVRTLFTHFDQCKEVEQINLPFLFTSFCFPNICFC